MVAKRSHRKDEADLRGIGSQRGVEIGLDADEGRELLHLSRREDLGNDEPNGRGELDELTDAALVSTILEVL